jgi:hypothetical protein
MACTVLAIMVDVTSAYNYLAKRPVYRLKPGPVCGLQWVGSVGHFEENADWCPSARHQAAFASSLTEAGILGYVIR